MVDVDVGVVASGFIHLLVSQISTRIVTFLLNLLIARHLSPEAYGLTSVQFHLIITTIFLLSREGFRRGCLRLGTDADSKDKTPDSARILSVAWLVVPVGLLVTGTVCMAVIGMSKVPGEEGRVYTQAVLLHGLAAVLELLAEPFYILALVQLHFKARMVMDVTATISKSALALLLVSTAAMHPATAFSLAQLAFSGMVLVGYLMYGLPALHKSSTALRWTRWGPVEREALWMTGLFTLQSTEKLLLGEGSKLVLVMFQSRYNQGVYGLVNNLGSLLVRTVLQPLEEVAFASFSRYQVKKGDEEGLRQMAQVLAVLTKAVAVLGLLTVSFGPSYSYTLLRLVYSTRWSETEAPMVLACYCAYILLLAINGITEAFVHAVLDRRSLQQSNWLLVALSLLHLGLCTLFISRAGAVGLVAADAVNMALRIATSLWYIDHYFQGLHRFNLSWLLPAKATLLACAAAAAAVAVSQQLFLAGINSSTPSDVFLQHAAVHVGVGVMCLAVLLAAMFKVERTTFMSLESLWRRSRVANNAGQDTGKND